MKTRMPHLIRRVLSTALALSMVCGCFVTTSFAASGTKTTTGALELEHSKMTVGTTRDIVLEYTLPVEIEDRAELYGTVVFTLPDGITADENDLINVAGRGDIALSQKAIENSADGSYDYSGVNYGYPSLSISADGKTITYANADFRPDNGTDIILTLKDQTVPAQAVDFTVEFTEYGTYQPAYTETVTLTSVNTISDFARKLTDTSYEIFTDVCYSYTAPANTSVKLYAKESGGEWTVMTDKVNIADGVVTITDLKANTQYEFKLQTAEGDSNIVSYYSGVFCVDDFGAVADGVTDDSDAIDAAIIAANAQGGGLVTFTAGKTYASTSIHMLSNAHIYMGKGSTLMALSGIDEYEPMNAPFSNGQDFGHSHFQCALFWAVRQDNITITCDGATINGDGNLNTGGLNEETNGIQGDKVFSFKLCDNITLQGASEESPLTFLSYGHFAFMATGCDNVTVQNLYVGDLDNQRDVVNFMQCNDVLAQNVTVVKCSNDIIKLGSDYSLGFVRNVKNTYVENIHAGYVGGGNVVQIGSETFGDFEDVYIKNVSISENANKAGLSFCVNDGGSIRNITIEDVTLNGCSGGIAFMASDRKGRVPDPMVKAGTIDNITISNATLTHNQGESGAIPVILSGFQAYRTINDMVEGQIYPITNITLNNVSIEASGSYTQTLEHADSQIANVGSGGCYRPSSYPNAKSLPAYALLITKVDGVTVNGGSLTYEDVQNNNRYALVLDNAKNVLVSDMTMMQGQLIGNVVDVRGDSSYTFTNLKAIPFTAENAPTSGLSKLKEGICDLFSKFVSSGIFSTDGQQTSAAAYPNGTNSATTLCLSKLAKDSTALNTRKNTIKVIALTTGQGLIDQLTSVYGRVSLQVVDKNGAAKDSSELLKSNDTLVVTSVDGSVQDVYTITVV